jgi:phage recombination protein Bet
MNAKAIEVATTLPAPVSRRGITESQWRTLANNLFPGAKSESVLMVWDYCVARKLDPMKKPCHIVPMYVKNANGDGEYRDVVMPGIYEYRTTANRTGQYMGHSRPEYGPDIEHLGTKAPEWCSLTVFRWNEASKQRVEFPVTVYFVEAAAVRKDKKTGELMLNDRWGKAPRQMLTKCAEAAGLREAFPDELGGEQTAEELEGHSEPIDITPVRNDPRGDLSGVDWELRDKHVTAIADLSAEYGSDEAKLAPLLKEYVDVNLREFHELFISVADKLAADGILSKSSFRKLLK